MGRQHIKDGVLMVKQQKTGVPLAIPLHPHLRAALDATPSEHLTFRTTENGRPFSGNHFSESFREWCDAPGLPKRCKPHGLRKAACRRLAEAGCSGPEIMALSGHLTLKELVRYTRGADQAKLAKNAMAKAITASPRTNDAPGGMSQRTCQSLWTDLTAPCALACLGPAVTTAITTTMTSDLKGTFRLNEPMILMPRMVCTPATS
jgi:hypothetical protein